MAKKLLSALVFIFSLSWSAFAGSITGTVTFNGDAPPARFIHMDADPVCYTVNKGNIHSQVFLLGEHHTLGNVFVYIKSGLPQSSYPAPAEEIVINQAGCNYSPHVMGVMAGQKVKFLNPDGTLHNVHAMCQINPEFNAAMPDFRKEMETSFAKPEGMFQVRCDVHPWMQAWIAVMAHPFFAVTGADGHFEIKGLAAGTYQIEAWQEKLGTQSATVTVAEGGAQTVNFAFSQPK